MKASKICCPHKDCGAVLEEGKEGALVDVFDRHLGVHGLCLDSEFKEDLQTRIVFIRDNGRIPRIDPFIVVPLDKCSRR
jgi:hypothetical protein